MSTIDLCGIVIGDPDKLGTYSSYSFLLDRDSLLLVLIDRCLPGHKTLTNAMEQVLRQIEDAHDVLLHGYKIAYLDSEECWDGVTWDGAHAEFYAIQRKDKP